MKKFKIFRPSHLGDVDEIANGWLEENPDVKILEWKFARKDNSYDAICILYEEPEKEEYNEPMRVSYNAMTNNTHVYCPACGHEEIFPGNCRLPDRYCPECSTRGRKLTFGATSDPLLRE